MRCSQPSRCEAWISFDPQSTITLTSRYRAIDLVVIDGNSGLPRIPIPYTCTLIPAAKGGRVVEKMIAVTGVAFHLAAAERPITIVFRGVIMSESARSSKKNSAMLLRLSSWNLLIVGWNLARPFVVKPSRPLRSKAGCGGMTMETF